MHYFDWKNAYNVIAILLLIPVTYLLTIRVEQYPLMLLSTIPILLLVIVFLYFANLERFKWFKASSSGLEAETVIQEAKSTTQEGKSTINQMKVLAKNNAETIIMLLQAVPREHIPDYEIEATKAKLFRTLEDLSVSKDNINDVKSVEYPYVYWDYCFYIRTALHRKVPQQHKSGWEEFWRTHSEKGIGYHVEPAALASFLTEIGLFDGEVRELVDDYRYYCEHHDHHRLEVWKNRTHWLRSK